MNVGNIWQKSATDCITKVMTNIHMKGLNASFQKVPCINIDPKKFPFLAYNIFFKSPDFLIFKTHINS